MYWKIFLWLSPKERNEENILLNYFHNYELSDEKLLSLFVDFLAFSYGGWILRFMIIEFTWI